MASPARRSVLAAHLPKRYVCEFARLHRQLTSGQETLAEVMQSMLEELRKRPDHTRLVMSMPGVGPVTALALIAYLGDCSRFSRPAQVCNYVGLVPRVDISGDTVRHGSITRRGCVPVRRAIVQGAWSLISSPYGGALRTFYERVRSRGGRKKAVVAVARKMVETIYVMVRSGTPYRDMPDDVLSRKLRTYALVA